MTRKQVIMAVGLAVVALLVAALLWWQIGLPLIVNRIQKLNEPPAQPAVPTEAGPGRQPPNMPQTLTTEFVGIGAVLRADQETGLPEVMNTIPGSPAERAGVTGGMLIQRVDDAPLAGLPLADVIGRIRGPVGTKIRLELIDPTQNLTNTVELTREPIHIESRQ